MLDADAESKRGADGVRVSTQVSTLLNPTVDWQAARIGRNLRVGCDMTALF
jgi:hypothetical protein